jgi:hypothetical protein
LQLEGSCSKGFGTDRSGFAAEGFLEPIAAASPPDVRRGSAAPVEALSRLGYAPGSAFGLNKLRTKSEPRAQPIIKFYI